MTFKIIILCVSALMVQTIYAGSCGSCGCGSLGGISSGGSSCVSNSGGSLLITSLGPISPSGISVASDLGLAGDLAVQGALPFLSAVDFKGEFPTKGSASVSYGCGDGKIGIDSVIGGGKGCGCCI